MSKMKAVADFYYRFKWCKYILNFADCYLAASSVGILQRNHMHKLKNSHEAPGVQLKPKTSK